MIKIILFFLITSCSSFNKIPKGDLSDKTIGGHNLPYLYKKKNLNILVMFDAEIVFQKPLNQWNQNLQYLLWQLSEKFELNIAISSLDNRYQFQRYATKKTKTPNHQELSKLTLSDLKSNQVNQPPGLLYTLNKLKYLSDKEMFDKNLDTFVILLSSKDDKDNYLSSDKLYKKDHFEVRLKELLSLNQEKYLNNLETKKYYNFRNFRLFSISPSNDLCNESNRKENYRYRLASQSIYKKYIDPNTKTTSWPDSYDYCKIPLNRIFGSIYNEIRSLKFYK